MPRRKSPTEKIAELEKKQAQIKAQIQDARAKLRNTERKRDTRRKIIAGAIALEAANHDPAFAAKLKKLMQEHITRPEDRELFDL